MIKLNMIWILNIQYAIERRLVAIHNKYPWITYMILALLWTAVLAYTLEVTTDLLRDLIRKTIYDSGIQSLVGNTTHGSRAV